MRSHLQGIFILLIVGIALMGIARIAAPVVQEAFGDDGAIVSEPGEAEDIVELASAEAEEEAALTSDELRGLQLYLTDLGFDPGPVDGVMGANTRGAIEAAIEEYQLEAASSDRDVYGLLKSITDALAAADTAESLDG